jgi:hypothetical protein
VSLGSKQRAARLLNSPTESKSRVTPGEDSELVPQQEVLDHKVPARADAGQEGREQQPEDFEHTFSIADLRAVRGFALPQPGSRGKR